MNSTTNYNLPTLSNEGGLASYLAQIKKLIITMFYLLSFLSIFNIFSSSCGKNEENSISFPLTG